MRWILIALAWTLTAAPVSAQTDDEKNCVGSNPDIAIIGCTAAIASGREGKSYLAVSYYARGNAYFAEDFLDQAISDYTEVITLQPDNALAHLNRGNAFGAKGLFDQAIADYDQAITMEPSLANPYAGRGQALEKKGARDQAVSDYRRAVKLNRDVPVAAAGLARLGAKP